MESNTMMLFGVGEGSVCGLEGVKEVLSEREAADWSSRAKALQQLQSFFSSINNKTTSLTAKEREATCRFIKDLLPHICYQLTERRSALTKETCLAIAATAEALFTERMFFEECVPHFLTALLKQLQITIKVISESAHRCILSMLRACGKHTTTFAFSQTIPVLCEGISATHPQHRGRCTEYIGVVLETPSFQSTSALNDEHLLDTIETALNKALVDAHPDARANARTALSTFNRLLPTRKYRALISRFFSLKTFPLTRDTNQQLENADQETTNQPTTAAQAMSYLLPSQQSLQTIKAAITMHRRIIKELRFRRQQYLLHPQQDTTSPISRPRAHQRRQ